MNHNIFTKVLTKYWKERFNGALTHMKDNFGIIPKCYEIFRRKTREVTFKSLPYILLYNYKKGVCSICNEKHSTSELTRCCLNSKIYSMGSWDEQVYNKKINKYKWVYDGYRDYYGDVYYKNIDDYNARCYANIVIELRKSMKLHIVKPFIP